MADIARPAGARLARRLYAIASAIGHGLLAILYGATYGAIGFYVAVILDYSGVGQVGMTVWLMVWVAAGSVLLTVFTLKWTGIGAHWFRRDNSRSDPVLGGTNTPKGTTPCP